MGDFVIMFENCVNDIIIILAFWHYWKDRNAENGFAKAFTGKLASLIFSQPFFGASDFGHIYF